MEALTSVKFQTFFSTDNPINKVHYSHPHHLQTCHVKLGSRNVQQQTQQQTTHAHQVFDEIPHSDTFLWNNLIKTCLTSKDPNGVISVYYQMILRGVRPDNHTLPRVLTACRHSRSILFGKQVHAHAFKLGLSSDHYIISALIDMYGRLDSVDTAKWLFDKTASKNSVTWTMLAKLYLTENKPEMAIGMFNQMVKDFKSLIDPVALATVISACSMLNSLLQGRKVHEIAKQCGLDSNVLVSNSLSKMYLDCDSLDEARDVFDRMPNKDVISWTEMIRGYVKTGQFNDGFKLLRQMIKEGIKPDSLSITTILPACARMSTHKHGKEIHAHLLRNGIHLNPTVHNAIIDMYVKSGFIELASKVFTSMNEKDIVSWTVMIMGYSLHGQGGLAIRLYQKMEKDSSIKVDEFTHAAILHACSTARMVERGKFYFRRIKQPKLTHCGLMVSLLARAGRFDEARAFIDEHGIEKYGEVVLKALLDGCRIHQEWKMGKRVIDQLCNMDPLNADNYVLLSNWYAENAKWDMVDEVRETITDMGLKPRSAYSWIEFRNKIHVFGTGDVSHPRSERVYWELRRWRKCMEDNGCLRRSDYTLHDVDEERECVQIGHSEMLAIAFGFVSTQPGTTIRVNKTLRVCRGCHDSAKFISKNEKREIVIKDPNCFHHFKNGFCSCEDFW